MSDGRPMTCITCGDLVQVYELPVPFIDPALYVCVDCLTGRPEPGQLTLADGTASRRETRSYDPAMSEIPF